MSIETDELDPETAEAEEAKRAEEARKAEEAARAAAARLALAKADRLTASKQAYNEQVRLMRKLGILPPGAKPKTKHFNLLAAHHNGMAAANRAISAQRDLAAFESAGGAGAMIMAILSNPAAKATERAYALQAMTQIAKAAPQIVSAAKVAEDEGNTFMIEDSELEAIEAEFGAGE